jgi:hypothetical protein
MAARWTVREEPHSMLHADGTVEVLGGGRVAVRRANVHARESSVAAESPPDRREYRSRSPWRSHMARDCTGHCRGTARVRAGEARDSVSEKVVQKSLEAAPEWGDRDSPSTRSVILSVRSSRRHGGAHTRVVHGPRESMFQPRPTPRSTAQAMDSIEIESLVLTPSAAPGHDCEPLDETEGTREPAASLSDSRSSRCRLGEGATGLEGRTVRRAASQPCYRMLRRTERYRPFEA